jgi:tetratricopeptide (TPR) repeat protein
MSTEHDRRNWTAEELSAYHRGELSSMDSFELESDALNDPLLSDALDAAADHDLASAKADLDEAWYKESVERVTEEESKAHWRLLRGIGTLVMVAFVSWSVWNLWVNEREIADLHREVADGSLKNDRLIDRYQDSLKLLEISLAQAIPEADQIDAVVAISNQNAQHLVEMEVSEDKSVGEREELDSIDALRPNEISAKTTSSLRIGSFPITYLHDLKVADYQEVNNGINFALPGLLTGTPAAFEKEEKKMEKEGINLSYSQLLDRALASFVNKDYKNTIVMLDRISDRLPRDENATFYKALCYYNLGKWDKASALFGQAQLHENKIFNEEAEYYRALSKWQDGDQEGALHLFGIIALNKGFYGDKASTFLKK